MIGMLISYYQFFKKIWYSYSSCIQIPLSVLKAFYPLAEQKKLGNPCIGFTSYHRLVIVFYREAFIVMARSVAAVRPSARFMVQTKLRPYLPKLGLEVG
jgi:hypothetical protein